MTAADAAVAEAATLFRLLSEPDRLRVFAAVVLGAATPGEIAAATGLDSRTVLRSLQRLMAGTLLDVAGVGYAVPTERLQQIARAAASAERRTDFGTGDASAEAVLRAFVRGGRVVQLPVHRGKRLVVLEHVVRVFEPGVRYPEREVNALLRAFHDDTATLRRYLVDEGLLARAAGHYWRIAGPVEV